MKVAVVFGTYNRLPMLQRAIASVRMAVGDLGYKIIVVDGGSTDGSRRWLFAQRDVVLICQEGPLTGAVRAFNLGFACAVDHGFKYVCHLNDDAKFVTKRAIAKAVSILETHPKVGEVAFEFDLRGPWGFEYVNGVPYANFGVIRTEVGIAVAKAQGDPTGRAWWNPIYRTYGADTEFGVWIWKLGWKVHEATGIRVHDENAQDDLRLNNACPGQKNGDSELFWSRWRHEVLPPPRPAYTTKVPPEATKKASWIIASHFRPRLLRACLLTLRDGIWPEGWSHEVVVAHHKDDLESERVAKDLGAVTVGTAGMAPGQKRNAALKMATGELVLVTDDDDMQSPLRPAAAIAAYEAGWPLSGIREFRRLHIPSGQVVRWCGRGKGESAALPPVFCGTARNYRRSLLVKLGGWRPLPSLEDSELHRRILQRRTPTSKAQKELDLGADLADTTIILQHDTNIFSRPEVAPGVTQVIGKYLCRGEGHWSQVPNFPDAVAARLGDLLAADDRDVSEVRQALEP